MNKTILQIPLDKKIRDQATIVAAELGFSSLQEPIRLFINRIAQRKVEFTITDAEEVQLSPRAIKRYEKMVDDIKKGKVKTIKSNSIEELMKSLTS